MDFDIDDIKPTALKRMLKAALLKNHKGDEKKASDDDADKEQEDLADLHREGKGDSNAPKVESDDIPVEVRKVAMNEDDDEDEKDDDKSPIDDAKKKSKAFPFKKKKQSFPFQKKKG
jgi:hypothetical protein